MGLTFTKKVSFCIPHPSEFIHFQLLYSQYILFTTKFHSEQIFGVLSAIGLPYSPKNFLFPVFTGQLFPIRYSENDRVTLYWASTLEAKTECISVHNLLNHVKTAIDNFYKTWVMSSG